MNKFLTVLVLLIAIASLAVGSVFVFMGFSKQNEVKANLEAEKVSYNLTDDKTASPKPIESMAELEKLASTLKMHRDSMAPSYSELTAKNPDHKFDPTNPLNLSYAQGMNLENSVLIAVLSFGMTWMMIGVGAFMIIVGLALLFISILQFRQK